MTLLILHAKGIMIPHKHTCIAKNKIKGLYVQEQKYKYISPCLYQCYLVEIVCMLKMHCISNNILSFWEFQVEGKHMHMHHQNKWVATWTYDIYNEPLIKMDMGEWYGTWHEEIIKYKVIHRNIGFDTWY